jgi:hypothetical protein
MSPNPSNLQALKGIEHDGILGLSEVLREEGLSAVRDALWDASCWHRDYSPPALRNRAIEKQKRKGWEMAVRIEKILCTALQGIHRWRVEETMIVSEEPERFYKSC